MGQLFGGLLFGSIGFIAFVHGKHEGSLKIMLLSAALMAYPYFVANLLALYAIGILLTTALFVWRDY